MTKPSPGSTLHASTPDWTGVALEAVEHGSTFRLDQSRDLFILYADRKLMTPEMIARLATQFHVP